MSNAWRQIADGMRHQHRSVVMPTPERLERPNLLLDTGAGLHPVLSLKSDRRPTWITTPSVAPGVPAASTDGRPEPPAAGECPGGAESHEERRSR